MERNLTADWFFFSLSSSARDSAWRPKSHTRVTRPCGDLGPCFNSLESVANACVSRETHQLEGLHTIRPTRPTNLVESARLLPAASDNDPLRQVSAQSAVDDAVHQAIQVHQIHHPPGLAPGSPQRACLYKASWDAAPGLSVLLRLISTVLPFHLSVLPPTSLSFSC